MDGDYNDKTNYLFLSKKQNQKKKKWRKGMGA